RNPQRQRPQKRPLSLQGRGSELVAQTHHVDPGIDVDVDVDLDRGAAQAGLAGGFDIDITNLGVDHPVVVEHVVSADLCCQTPGVFQAEAVKAGALGGAAQLFIEEPGEVHTGTHVGLEGRTVIQRVVHRADSRRQVLDAAQLVDDTGHADVVAERGGSQQLDTDLVGQHVGKVQTQLGVAVQSGAGTGQRCASQFYCATALTRINSGRAGADDNASGLVGLGEGSRQQSGNKQQA